MMAKDYFAEKRVLVTGATGVIGVSLSRALWASGAEVHINYLNDPERYLWPLLGDDLFAHHRFDVCDAQTIAELPDYDAVFHLSGYGQPKKFTQNPVSTFLLNTAALQELVKKVKPGGKFLFASTSEVYVNSPSTHEDAAIGIDPNNVRNCYILGKLAGEQYLQLVAPSLGVDAKSVRICLAYGPYFKKTDTRVLNEFIAKAVDNGEIDLMDDGSAKRQYIYVDDAVEMMLNIAANGRHTLYNVGGKDCFSVLGVAHTVAGHTGAVVRPGRAQDKLAGSPAFAGVDISRYEAEFGWPRLTTLCDGVKKCVDWYKAIK